MKKQLLWLIIPIILCILGVVYFQVDWLMKTYHTELGKINSHAKEAFQDALEDFNKENQEALVEGLTPQLSALVDTVEIQFSNDSLHVFLEMGPVKDFNKLDSGKVQVARNAGRVQIHLPSFYAPKDIYFKALVKGDAGPTQTLEHQLSGLFRSNDQYRNCETLHRYFTDDSTRLSSLFNEHLEIAGLSILKSNAQIRWYCGSQASIQTSHLLDSRVFPYISKGVIGYIAPKQWVGVSMQGYQKALFSRMLIPILLSLIMILIMIACFVYLMRTILKQRQLAELKEQYINNMTHELKTPLAVIAASVEGMQRFRVLEDKEKTQRYLDTASAEIARLKDFITKLLNISMYEQNAMELVKQPLDLPRLLHALTEVEEMKTEKTVQFSLDVPDQLSIVADPLHFRNVLSNVLDNAIKYGGDAVEVKITAYQEEGQVYIRVQDNGPGIAPDQLKFIFDRFYRVQRADSQGAKGSGLGLFYARYIMERHGGRLWVESSLGQGSTFILSLPLK